MSTITKRDIDNTTAVEIKYQLITPAREDIYESITS